MLCFRVSVCVCVYVLAGSTRRFIKGPISPLVLPLQAYSNSDDAGMFFSDVEVKDFADSILSRQLTISASYVIQYLNE